MIKMFSKKNNNGDIGGISPQRFTSTHIFHSSLQRFRRAENFLYIIIISTIDPFTSDGHDESNFFRERQSYDYAHAPLTAPALALERDLSKKRKLRSQRTRQFTIQNALYPI